MVIGIGNLPVDCTIDEIRQLLAHVEVESVRTAVSDPPDNMEAWVTVNVQDRNWLNSVAHNLEGRVHRGRLLEASALLFFSH